MYIVRSRDAAAAAKNKIDGRPFGERHENEVLQPPMWQPNVNNMKKH